MRSYRRLQTLGLAALLATITTLHCLPNAQADRRRSTTFLAASSQDSWPEWDGQDAPALTDAYPTTGWPREYGKICVTFTSGDAGEHHAIIDGRQDGDDPRPYLAVVNDGRIRFGIQTVGSIAGGEVIPGKVHTACVERHRPFITTLILDGTLIGTSATLPAWDWHPTARLGSRYGDADPLGGEIKYIQWRGFRLACDMTSDTCSDGRKIVTERATPVPCETSPGVWQTIPEDTGCYSVRGLEPWAQNTSYLSWGAELDRSPWGIQGDAEIMQLADGFRICQTTSSVNSGIRQTHTIGLDETATLSVIARRNTASGLFLTPFSNGGGPITMSPAGWGTYSRTETRTGAAVAFIYPRPGGVAHCVDLLAAWLTKTDTPGRPCWGGEAPVTCAADRHTISTEGWPTEAGEISMVVHLGPPTGQRRYLWDSREATANPQSRSSISETGVWETRLPTQVIVSDLDWPEGTYRVRFERRDGAVYVYRDGALVGQTASASPMAHGPHAFLGRSAGANTQHLGGSISSLRVRSFE